MLAAMYGIGVRRFALAALLIGISPMEFAPSYRVSARLMITRQELASLASSDIAFKMVVAF